MKETAVKIIQELREELKSAGLLRDTLPVVTEVKEDAPQVIHPTVGNRAVATIDRTLLKGETSFTMI